MKSLTEQIKTMESDVHVFHMKNRKQIELSGIRKVDHFDAEEFYLETILGMLVLRGQNLVIMHFDHEAGNIRIEGHIHTILYMDEEEREKTKGIFHKLFR